MASTVETWTKIQIKGWRAAGLFSSLRSWEALLSSAFAATFFSQDLRLGRALALIVFLGNVKGFLCGAIGAYAAELTGRFFSQNKPLCQSKIFALNGLFLGLALCSVLGLTSKTLLAIIVFAAISAVFVVAADRLLKTWDLPVIVIPYCLAFWCFQLVAQSSVHWRFTVGDIPQLALENDLLRVAVGSLLGFGQIFFSGEPWTALAVCFAVIFFNRKMALQIMLAAVLPTFAAFFLVGPHWVIFSGLAAFGGVLLFHAYSAGVLPLMGSQIWSFITITGVFEVVGIKLVENLNIYLISGAYVFTFWLARLCVETRRGFSTGAQAKMSW